MAERRSIKEMTRDAATTDLPRAILRSRLRKTGVDDDVKGPPFNGWAFDPHWVSMFPIWELVRAITGTKATAQALRLGHNELVHVQNRGNVRLGIPNKKNSQKARSQFHRLDIQKFAADLGFVVKHGSRIVAALRESGLVQVRYKGDQPYFRPRVLTRDGAVAFVEWMQRYACFPQSPWWDRNAEPVDEPDGLSETAHPGPTGPGIRTHRFQNVDPQVQPSGPTGPTDPPETRGNGGDEDRKEGTSRKREEKKIREVPATATSPEYREETQRLPTHGAEDPRRNETMGGAELPQTPQTERMTKPKTQNDACATTPCPHPKLELHKGGIFCTACGDHLREATEDDWNDPELYKD